MQGRCRTSERENWIIHMSRAGNIFSHFIIRPNLAKMSAMPSGVMAGCIRWTKTILSLIDVAADCTNHTGRDRQWHGLYRCCHAMGMIQDSTNTGECISGETQTAS